MVARLPAGVGDNPEGLPLKDVAAAGGWKDTASLLACYHHADPETAFRVVNESLRVAAGGS
jgi:hypothetical protein